MMITARFFFTAFVIVVATLWGTARQANAVMGSSPGSGSMGSFQRTPTGDYRYWHGHRTTTHYSKHKHQH